MDGRENDIRDEDARAARDAEGVAALLCKMGFERLHLQIPSETYAAWGLRDQETRSLLSVRLLGQRAGVRALLFELDERPTAATLHALASARRRRDPAARELLVLAGPGYEELVLAVRVTGQEPLATRRLLLQPAHLHSADIETLREMAGAIREEPADGSAARIAFRLEQALDRERVTDRFFRVFRSVLDSFKTALAGLPAGARERESVAHHFCLLTLNRLLFLYFIQKKGWLDGDRAFIPHLFERAARERRPFFDLLRVLFFGVLNTPASQRDPEARQLGRFPYLNGGLFEPDAIERRYPQLALPDGAFAIAIERLLEKFRFTVREDPELEQEAGVDPEMLGKVFESLMDEQEREESGSFYTPRELVRRMVRRGLAEHLRHRARLEPETARRLVDDGDASGIEPAEAERAFESLRSIRVLDPAAGSGAFLLGMLSELARAQQALAARLGLPPEPSWVVRRRIIHRNLYGVDIKGTAVRLCDLRLWLALAVDLVEPDVTRVPPLPNLDHKVKQGDSLLSPLDLVDASTSAAAHARVRERLGNLVHLKDAYESSSGKAKLATAKALAERETEIALDLLDWKLSVLDEKLAGPAAMERGTDLWGGPIRLVPGAARELRALRREKREVERMRRRLLDGGDLPAFGFDIHFAEAVAAGGFDLVIGNPPWVRLSKIPEAARSALRKRYGCFGDACWRPAGTSSGGGSQADMSVLFTERAMELTRSGGILSLLLPSKVLSALYGGGLRRALLTGWSPLSIEDHSGASRKLFRADTFPAVVTARKAPLGRESKVSVRVEGLQDRLLEFETNASSLPSFGKDGASPWRLLPPAVARALEQMRAFGPALRPAMGLKTGNNRVFLVEDVRDAGEGVVRITSRGFRDPAEGRQPSAYLAEVEREGVRPVIQGEGLEAWSVQAPRSVLCPAPGRKLIDRFLKRHDVSGTDGAMPGHGPMVVWKDIAKELSAALVDAPLPGRGWAVPLNTTNYVSVKDADEGHFVAALLNSTPARAFAASLAPRAKDGYLRFPCWSVALLPIPPAPRGKLAALSERLHTAGQEDAVSRRALDRLVARAYGLSDGELAELEEWLAFVTGRPRATVKEHEMSA